MAFWPTGLRTQKMLPFLTNCLKRVPSERELLMNGVGLRP